MKFSSLARITATVCLLALWVGCATSKTASRSEIELDIDKLQSTGKLSIKSPKDVDLQDIRVIKKGADYSVTIGQWRAVVSAAAIEGAKADAAARQAMNSELVGMVRLLAEKAAASQGVPMSSTASPSATRAGPQTNPDVMPAVTTFGAADGVTYKVIVRNGVLLLAPVDDVAPFNP